MFEAVKLKLDLFIPLTSKFFNKNYFANCFIGSEVGIFFVKKVISPPKKRCYHNKGFFFISLLLYYPVWRCHPSFGQVKRNTGRQTQHHEAAQDGHCKNVSPVPRDPPWWSVLHDHLVPLTDFISRDSSIKTTKRSYQAKATETPKFEPRQLPNKPKAPRKQIRSSSLRPIPRLRPPP